MADNEILEIYKKRESLRDKNNHYQNKMRMIFEWAVIAPAIPIGFLYLFSNIDISSMQAFMYSLYAVVAFYARRKFSLKYEREMREGIDAIDKGIPDDVLEIIYEQLPPIRSPEDISVRIIYERQRLGLSQAAAAQAVGISSGTYYLAEMGEHALLNTVNFEDVLAKLKKM